MSAVGGVARVLIVDDDRDLVDLLSFALQRAGFTPKVAFDAQMALESVQREPPDVIVLDLTLGRDSGLDVLREIRRTSRVPIILLTARASEEDKIQGLTLGADDYLTKPFSHRELVARLQVQLRRREQPRASPRHADTVLEVGPLRLNAAEHAASRAGQPLSLTVTEFRLLHYLLLHAGTVVSARELLRQVWGYPASTDTDLVRVTVFRLRRKIEADPAHPQLLHTVPGVGFLLKVRSSTPDTDPPKVATTDVV